MWKLPNQYAVIVLRISLLLFFSMQSAVIAQTPASNRLILPQIRSNSEETGIFEIALNNVEAVSAGQIRLTCNVSAGIDITGVSLTPRTDEYEPPLVQSKMIDPATIEVFIIFYSLRHATITPGEGAILTVHYRQTGDGALSTSLKVTDIVFADPANRPVAVQIEPGNMMRAMQLFSDFSSAQELNSSLTVPEPTALTIWLLGLGLLWFISKRFQKAAR